MIADDIEEGRLGGAVSRPDNDAAPLDISSLYLPAYQDLRRLGVFLDWLVTIG